MKEEYDPPCTARLWSGRQRGFGHRRDRRTVGQLFKSAGRAAEFRRTQYSPASALRKSVLPPVFSTSFTSRITMPGATALPMS